MKIKHKALGIIYTVRIQVKQKNGWHTLDESVKPMTIKELDTYYSDYDSFWYIDGAGKVCETRTRWVDENTLARYKKLNNYFESREEAEKTSKDIERTIKRTENGDKTKNFFQKLLHLAN